MTSDEAYAEIQRRVLEQILKHKIGEEEEIPTSAPVAEGVNCAICNTCNDYLPSNVRYVCYDCRESGYK